VSNSSTCTPPRLAGITRQNVALIVFVAIGAVLGMIAAYFFTSTTFRWILVIALALAAITAGAALTAYYYL